MEIATGIKFWGIMTHTIFLLLCKFFVLVIPRNRVSKLSTLSFAVLVLVLGGQGSFGTLSRSDTLSKF
jgi:hypothetical protein